MILNDTVIIEGALATVLATVIVGSAVSVRKTLHKMQEIPREIVLLKAAVFRLLRSNKVQGTGIITIAKNQQSGTTNGTTETTITAVELDQKKIDLYLQYAALGKVFIEEDGTEYDPLSGC